MRDVSDIIYHVFFLSGCPKFFVFGHESISMTSTKVKEDHSISSWRNKEILWKQSSFQRPHTFDCFLDHGKPQDEGNMLTATKRGTPADWSPGWHRCEKLQTRRALLFPNGFIPSVKSMDYILHIVKAFPSFYGTTVFIAVFTTACQLSQLWARPNQSPSPDHIF